MTNYGQAPLVRYSYASDPNFAKVQAALALWRRALAHRMLNREHPERPEQTAADHAE